MLLLLRKRTIYSKGKLYNKDQEERYVQMNFFHCFKQKKKSLIHIGNKKIKHGKASSYSRFAKTI